jgi:hypothetical protein
MSKRPTIKKPPKATWLYPSRTCSESRDRSGFGVGLRNGSAAVLGADGVRFALALDVSMDEFLHPKAKRAVTKKPNRRVLRRMEKIESLPFHQQTHLLKTIDGFLKGVGVAF